MKLVGNETLKKKITSNLSHAYLISGAKGSGRSILIKHLSQLAQCSSGGREPCGECNHCRKVEAGIHPDVLFYGEEKPLLVEQVRQLRKSCFIRPNEGKRKVYIIYQADALNTSGQNALLKILEEPPAYGLFLLVTEESVAVLETIRSRCQQLQLFPVLKAEASQWLQSRYPERDDISEMAESCQGYLGRAVAMAEPDRATKKLEEAAEREKLLTGKKVVRKLKKDQLPPETIDYTPTVSKVVEAMIKGEELNLLEACLPLEKFDKAQMQEVLPEVRLGLCNNLKETKNKEVLACIHLLDKVMQGLFSNVSSAQIVVWLTAGRAMKSGGKK